MNQAKAEATALVLSHAYAREPARSDLMPEQTHDGCEWLDEEDGVEDVSSNRRTWDRCVRSPAIGQNKRRCADRENDTGAQNSRGNHRDYGRIRRLRLASLGDRAASIRLRLCDDAL
jgi:hypothetical protein